MTTPNVRRWLVKYWGPHGGDTLVQDSEGKSVYARSRHDGYEVLSSCVVWAPNQRFARWNAREVIGWPHSAMRVSVSIYRGVSS